MGYFDYTTMGFGEVVTSQEELVDLIIYYIKNNCKMIEKYEERVGQFFAHSDRNNCQRIYDQLTLEERNV